MNTRLRCLWSALLSLCLLAACQGQAAGPEPLAAEEDVPLFSQAELDQILAPIALYPDSLLSQLLMAATYPLEVVEASRWSNANPGLKGQEAVRAVDDKGWDPSIKSMVAFPDVLRRMDADIEWTRDLGDAFLAQQQQVMDTIQQLRQRAEDAGNLESNQHLQVVREREIIYLRDPYPDRVYVPWYDPWHVYGAWWWPSYRPAYWDPWPGYQRYGTYYYWGPTILVGHGFYYGHCDWRARQVRIVQAPPFYYRRPVPERRVWVHEYQHRRGVPYRDVRVHERYADQYARPPKYERRDRRETERPVAGQEPVEQPASGRRQREPGPEASTPLEPQPRSGATGRAATETRESAPRQRDGERSRQPSRSDRTEPRHVQQPPEVQSGLAPSQSDSRPPAPVVTAPSRAEPRQSKPRQVEPRQIETRQYEPRQVEPRQSEPRQIETRQYEPRQVEPRRIERANPGGMDQGASRPDRAYASPAVPRSSAFAGDSAASRATRQGADFGASRRDAGGQSRDRASGERSSQRER